MTNFDYSNLTVSSFAETEQVMRATSSKLKNDLAVLKYTQRLFSKLGSEALAVCVMFGDNAELCVLKAHMSAQ